MLTKGFPGCLHFVFVSMPLVNALRPILFDMVQAVLNDVG